MQVFDKSKCDFSDKFTTGNINFFYEVPLNLFKRNIIIISYQDALAYFFNNRRNDFPDIFFDCKIYNLSLKCTQCASTTGIRTFISTLPWDIKDVCLRHWFCIITDTNSSLTNASVPVVIDQREFVLNNIREVSILLCIFDF